MVAQQRGYQLRLRAARQGEPGQDQRAHGVRRPGRGVPDGGGARRTRGSYYSVSDRLVREIDGAWKPDQYSNPNNPRSHYETTGPEIWEQTDGRITHFVTGVGTGGTISGTGRYLKEVSDGQVQVVGADPEGSVYSGGTGRPYLVEGVGEDFWPSAYDPTVTDEIVAVCDRDSFLMTRRLAREEGLLVGGSCGMAVVAALRVAERLDCGRRRRGAAARRRPRLPRQDLQRRLDGRLRLPRRRSGEHDGRRRARGARAADCRTLVHVHPYETVREAIDILREYSVSQMPVVKAEPPVTAGEVVGSVSREGAARPAVLRARASRRRAGAAHVGAAADRRVPGSRCRPPRPRWRRPTRCSCTTTASRPVSSPVRTCSASSPLADRRGRPALVSRLTRRVGRAARPARPPTSRTDGGTAWRSTTT